jgi:hypothetical protein
LDRETKRSTKKKKSGRKKGKVVAKVLKEKYRAEEVILFGSLIWRPDFLWAGTDIDPLGHSGYKVHPIVSQDFISEIPIGIKYNQEVLMEAGKNVTKETLTMKIGIISKIRVTVALVAACLLAAPSTRAHKQ